MCAFLERSLAFLILKNFRHVPFKDIKSHIYCKLQITSATYVSCGRRSCYVFLLLAVPLHCQRSSPPQSSNQPTNPSKVLCSVKLKLMDWWQMVAYYYATLWTTAAGGTDSQPLLQWLNEQGRNTSSKRVIRNRPQSRINWDKLSLPSLSETHCQV